MTNAITFLFVHKIQEEALFLAVGAVAMDDFLKIGFHLIAHCAAVTPARVGFHAVQYNLRKVYEKGIYTARSARHR